MFKIQTRDFIGDPGDFFKFVEKFDQDPLKFGVSEVLEQYLSHITQNKELDFETATEFLSAAINLLDLKTNAILPEKNYDEQPIEEEALSGEELAEHLSEYKTFKEAAIFLNQQFKSPDKIRGRQADVGYYIKSYLKGIDESPALEDIKLLDLLSAFEDVAKRQDDEEDTVFKVNPKRYKVADKVKELKTILSRYNEGIEFNSIFLGKETKGEIIVTFLALLELVRLQGIRIRQKENFGAIIIYPITK